MRNAKSALKVFCIMAAAAWGLVSGGCGYSLSPNPYGLMEPLAVSVPLAVNQSRFADIGPWLTQDLITRLDASSHISVREDAAARLILTVAAVNISGGSWQQPEREDDYLPTDSASRVIYLTVEAVLERPNPDGGQPLVRRHLFNGQRTFLVGSDQAQVELRQRAAFQWLAADLGQKIAQTMFSEF